MQQRLNFIWFMLCGVLGLCVAAASPTDEALQRARDAYQQQDYATALREWRPLAQQGEPKAQYNLGRMYERGEGVAQDEVEAVRLYRQAAEQGLAQAQYNLGVMYAQGRVGIKDEVEAVRLYRQAAEQGLASAQNNLGRMYAEGRGVPQDEAEAVRLYRQAAEQGLADAQYNLGVMYAEGRGVAQDLAEAQDWFAAAAQTYPLGAARNDAIQARDRVARQRAASQAPAPVSAANTPAVTTTPPGSVPDAPVAETPSEHTLGIGNAADPAKPLAPPVNHTAMEYGSLGRRRLFEGQFVEAREASAKARAVDPHNVTWAINLGHSFLLTGDAITARAHYFQALLLFPSEEAVMQGPVADLDRFITQGWQGEACQPVRTWMRDTFGKILRWRALHAQLAQRTESGPQAAIPTAEETVRLAEDVFAGLPFEVATSLTALAALYSAQGQYGQAEPLLQQALRILEQTLPPMHPDVATSLIALAALYSIQGKYGEAELPLQRALVIQEQALGPMHPDVASRLIALADNYRKQDRYGEAAASLQRALVIQEQALPPTHPDVASRLISSAALSQVQGQYGEAAASLQRALAIQEQALGPTHPDIALSLNNLAELYRTQGQYGQAEPLYQRALALREQAPGPPPDVAFILNNLALLYYAQGQYGQAVPLWQRAQRILEQALGSTHPDIAVILNDLAEIYHDQRQYGEAAASLQQALAIREQALGSMHPDVAVIRSNLAAVYHDQGQYEQAEPLLQRAIAIQQTLGPTNPSLATSFNNLSALYRARKQYDKALEAIRQATAIHRSRATRVGTQRSRGLLSEQAIVHGAFVQHVLLLVQYDKQLATQASIPKQQHTPTLRAEACEVMQLAQASSTAVAMANMATRFSLVQGPLTQTIRAYQDAVMQWQRQEDQLVKALSQPLTTEHADAHQDLYAALETWDQRIRTLKATLERESSDYTDLTLLQPVPAPDLQAFLRPDEALLSYLIGAQETVLLVLRADRMELFPIALGAQALYESVAGLRAGLDQAHVVTAEDLRPFPLRLAYDLYTALVAPARPLLDGVRHLMIVPDGALHSLPFGVLVTDAPTESARANVTVYRQVAWLAQRYALTVLPSLGALRLLRGVAKPAPGHLPFIGFGDPVLAGPFGASQGATDIGLVRGGGVANVEAVRQLPTLPQSAAELVAIARALQADPQQVYIREAATETRVRTMDLTPFRIVGFSTHGLLPGQVPGLDEPALVLTPPAVGTREDDGLLTASEIAQLHLNADWVMLSACNTAVDSPLEAQAPATMHDAGPLLSRSLVERTPATPGLTSLAQAFFYAGTRALLVSHWEVDATTAARLTTEMLALAARFPEQGRAVALQGAMRALLLDPTSPAYAHPTFWAPFVVMGEGGAPPAR